jgi:hippurate hydrolase
VQVCSAFNVEARFDITDSYPSIVNTPDATALVTDVCTTLFGRDRVLGDLAPMAGAEDFSYYLKVLFSSCEGCGGSAITIAISRTASASGERHAPPLTHVMYVQARPGCFVQLGGREADTVQTVCHQPGYDFNDKILPIGMALWVRLLERIFGASLYPEDGFFPALPPVNADHLRAFIDATV